ncbi:proteasome subunit alpha type-2-like [Teleopsis dalmanni]|uniref:proteasome subunit alpha type-2-like n=1 Tax=Teleopsis dalmanni TaxID=139649 RepID=UPI0018CD7551|nr:proteasome subunit alpha type-2-like [Teleopsis dalmanni]
MSKRVSKFMDSTCVAVRGDEHIVFAAYNTDLDAFYVPSPNTRIRAVSNKTVMAYAGDQTGGQDLWQQAVKDRTDMYPQYEDEQGNVAYIANYLFSVLHNSTIIRNGPLSLVSCIVAGFDVGKSYIYKVDKTKVDVIDKVTAVGYEEHTAQNYLNQHCNRTIDELTGIMIALGSLTSKGQTDVKHIEVGVLSKGQPIRMISQNDITDYLCSVPSDSSDEYVIG